MGTENEKLVSNMKYKEGLLSIIIPVYNVEPYINKCLESVINQTYPYLDIIVVDDGSTDGSGQICDAYQKVDNRIKVFHKKNEGLSSARNLGLRYAKGEYLGFVDGDDYIAVDMYESLIKCLEDDVDIVTCGRCQIYPPKIRKSKRKKLCAQTKMKYETEQAMEELLKGNLFSYGVCDKIYRKELFDDIRFPRGRVSEDLPVTYALFKKCRNVVNIGEAKYYQFRREDSISRRDFYFRRIDNVLFHRDILENINKEYPQFSNIAEANFISSVVRRVDEIRESKDRISYIELEKRLIKVLKRMQLRVIFNKYLNRQQKEKIFRIARTGIGDWRK